MWARKCLPPLWPSRIKVVITGFLICLFINSFSGYLGNADVTYLDLSSPSNTAIRCGHPPVRCENDTQNALMAQRMLGDDAADVDPLLHCAVNQGKRSMVQAVMEMELSPIHFGIYLDNNCSSPSQALQTCANKSVPLASITGIFARLHTVNRLINPLLWWSIQFTLFMYVLAVSVLIHDLALIQAECRPRILSMEGASRELPCSFGFVKCLMGWGSMRAIRTRCRPLWFCLLPFWVVYQSFTFIVCVYCFILLLLRPCSSICRCSCDQPVKLSRVMVFASSTLTSVWAVIFVVTQIYYFRTDVYALLWTADDADVTGALSKSCVCYCEYPLSYETESRVMLLSLAVILGCLGFALRSLKGLRHPQWASLFSNQYAIPIEAWPTRWTSMYSADEHNPYNAEPIRFRRPGEEVQGEPAFDPFALMDEQATSASLLVKLRPEWRSEEQMREWAEARGYPDEHDDAETEVGCCGFPILAQQESVPKLAVKAAKEQIKATKEQIIATKNSVAHELETRHCRVTRLADEISSAVRKATAGDRLSATSQTAGDHLLSSVSHDSRRSTGGASPGMRRQPSIFIAGDASVHLGGTSQDAEEVDLETAEATAKALERQALKTAATAEALGAKAQEIRRSIRESRTTNDLLSALDSSVSDDTIMSNAMIQINSENVRESDMEMATMTY